MRNFSVFLIILIQTGYYLYVESSGTRPGDRAELVSPWLSGRPDFMYGKTMGSLALKLTLSHGRNWYIFYKKRDQDQYWIKAIGNMDPPTGLRYRVSICRKLLGPLQTPNFS